MVSEDQLLAVVDLGSNSFHLAIVQEDNGRLVVVDRIKTMVQLAYGLNDDKSLCPETREKALLCLSQFGERLAGLPKNNIRIVGTNTLRRLKDPTFIKEAESKLGYPIEIISGKEEARLVYLGVVQYADLYKDNVLVFDIGGGSTEVILGQKTLIHKSFSLDLGCVSLSKQFFPDHKINKKLVKEAEFYLEYELLPVQLQVDSDNCEILGASGTIQTLQKLLAYENLTDEIITQDGLKELLSCFIALGNADNIADHYDITTERAKVITGGLLILKRLMALLNIQSLRAVDTALREGVILDLLGRNKKEDMRDITIESLVSRMGADSLQGKRVEKTALYMAEKIDFQSETSTSPLRYLAWSALLHEIGLAISYHRYYRHSAYLVGHADLDGFSRQDQKILETIIYNHKRNLKIEQFENLPDYVLVLALILRFSVLLNRSREVFPLPEFDFSFNNKTLYFRFPDHWLAERPLIQEDFRQETRWLKDAGITLDLS